MKRIIVALAFAFLGLPVAHAQSDILIDIDRGRTEGIFTKTPVFQRAILVKPEKATDTALLFFRGYPGISRIQSVEDKRRNLIPFMRLKERMFLEEGIALVIVDCPTDQWGAPGPHPTACHDNYRSSTEHAYDVRSVIARLKGEHGLAKFYVMGHSLGTISSRWLARHLGTEIAGSIHSASINVPNPRGLASSMPGFAYDSIAAPVLHVHHENDACRGNPYSMVKAYTGDNLVTVRGGTPEGDPCGGTHLHSYPGREEVVVSAVVSWIKTRKVERIVG
jgi:hypothetical protein